MSSDVEELAKLIYPDYHGHNIIPVEAREAAERIVAAGWTRRSMPGEAMLTIAMCKADQATDDPKYARCECSNACACPEIYQTSARAVLALMEGK